MTANEANIRGRAFHTLASAGSTRVFTVLLVNLLLFLLRVLVFRRIIDPLTLKRRNFTFSLFLSFALYFFDRALNSARSLASSL